MKTKYLLLLTGLALALPATRVLAGSGIVGSVHDFTSIKSASSYSWNTTNESTCQVCHTPHGADTTSLTGTAVPLWIHATSTQHYTLYADPSGEMTAAGVTETGISGISLACLSCHDGSLAVNQSINGKFSGGATPSVAGGLVPTWAMVTGTGGANNLAQMHPISITYPTNFPFISSTSTALTTGTGLAGDLWPTTNPTISTLLYGGKVECSSCHDVHSQIGDAPKAGSDLLKIALTDFDSTGRGDTLCRTCHIK